METVTEARTTLELTGFETSGNWWSPVEPVVALGFSAPTHSQKQHERKPPCVRVGVCVASRVSLLCLHYTYMYCMRTQPHTHWGWIYLWMCGWVQWRSRFSSFTSWKMRPVSDELHLWCSVPRTVMMHETSNDHWFTFAFNYSLAQTAHMCVCLCVWLCVCKSVGAGPTECTDRAEVLPPSLVHRNTTANHKVTSATSTGTKGQIWSWTYFQSSSVPFDCSSHLSICAVQIHIFATCRFFAVL